MKKSIITFVIIFAFTGIFANTNTADITDYVVTEDGITYVKKLRIGVNNNLIGITSEGDKINFDKADVKIYRKNGREFKRLYLVNEGSDYVKNVFLERIYTRAGYSIYKKESSASEKMNLNNFYVYYEDKLELQLNKENYKDVLSFFFPKFNLLFAS